MLAMALASLLLAAALAAQPRDGEDYSVQAYPRRSAQQHRRRPSFVEAEAAANPSNMRGSAPAELRGLPSGARPSAPIFDPMAAGLLSTAAAAGAGGTGTLPKLPKTTDLILFYSFAEVNYLDGWARFVWLQYSCIAATLWANGEMMATIKDLRDYWYGSSLAPPMSGEPGGGGGGGEVAPAAEAPPAAAAAALEANRARAAADAADAARAARAATPATVAPAAAAAAAATARATGVPSMATPAGVAGGSAWMAAQQPGYELLSAERTMPSSFSSAAGAAAVGGEGRDAYRRRLNEAMVEVSALDGPVARGAAALLQMAETWGGGGIGGGFGGGGFGGGGLGGGGFGFERRAAEGEEAVPALFPPLSADAKKRRQAAVEKSVEWLKLMACQQQLWGSSMLVGAVRSSQAAQMLEFQGTSWEDETPWRRYWLSRRLQLEWLTNSAVETWQAYAIPEGQLKLAKKLMKVNPKMSNWLMQITLADEPMMTMAHKLLQRYALRAEWYVWQCWKAQNAAEYMLALAFYQETLTAKGAAGAATNSAGLFVDKWALLKLWLPTLTARVTTYATSLVSSKVLLETPDDVVQALFMWAPPPSSEGGAPAKALERDDSYPASASASASASAHAAPAAPAAPAAHAAHGAPAAASLRARRGYAARARDNDNFDSSAAFLQEATHTHASSPHPSSSWRGGGGGGGFERDDEEGGGGDGPSRVHRFKKATHAALPYVAMQFAGSLLYRNYFVRLLLNSQLQASTNTKLTAAKHALMGQMRSSRASAASASAASAASASTQLRSQQASAAVLGGGGAASAQQPPGAPRGATQLFQQQPLLSSQQNLTAAQNLVNDEFAAQQMLSGGGGLGGGGLGGLGGAAGGAAGGAPLAPAFAQPLQSGLAWQRAQQQMKQQLNALLAQQAAQRQQLAAQLLTPGSTLPMPEKPGELATVAPGAAGQQLQQQQQAGMGLGMGQMGMQRGVQGRRQPAWAQQAAGSLRQQQQQGRGLPRTAAELADSALELQQPTPAILGQQQQQQRPPLTGVRPAAVAALSGAVDASPTGSAASLAMDQITASERSELAAALA